MKRNQKTKIREKILADSLPIYNSSSEYHEKDFDYFKLDTFYMNQDMSMLIIKIIFMIH